MNENVEFFFALKFRVKEAIGKFNRRFEEECVKYLLSKFGCNDYTAKQVYQDAFTETFINVAKGKLTSFEKHPVGYIKTIAGRLILKHKKEEGRFLYDSESYFRSDLFLELSEEEKEHLPERIMKLRVALDKLSSRCRELLIGRIVYNTSNSELAEDLGYANPNSVSTATNNCKEKLTDLLKNLSKTKVA